MSKRAAGVDNTARRTWDKEEFEEKAAEREAKADKEAETAQDIKKRKRLERDPLHQGLIVERSTLKHREYQLDLASRLGKSQVIGLNTPLSQQAGYFCSVCNCVLRDSQSYLDHVNGKYHQRALGMNMNVEKSTLEQVRNRLQQHKQQAQQRTPGDDYLPDGIDRRVAEAEEAEERARQERKERKKAEKEKAKAAAAEEEGGGDEEMMALMGFGGFGGGKKP